jgi:hypothetical protein
MTPSARSLKRLRQIARWLGDDLVRILPDKLALASGSDAANGQAALFDQPCAVTRPANRLLGVRIKPANTPDRIAPLEMPANFLWHRQMQVEPVELVLQLVQNPIRTAIPVKIPGRLKKAGLHPARRMDERRHKPHIHGDHHAAKMQRVPLKFRDIQDIEMPPSAALGLCRRETFQKAHIDASHWSSP